MWLTAPHLDLITPKNFLFRIYSLGRLLGVKIFLGPSPAKRMFLYPQKPLSFTENDLRLIPAARSNLFGLLWNGKKWFKDIQTTLLHLTLVLTITDRSSIWGALLGKNKILGHHFPCPDALYTLNLSDPAQMLMAWGSYSPCQQIVISS